MPSKREADVVVCEAVLGKFTVLRRCAATPHQSHPGSEVPVCDSFSSRRSHFAQSNSPTNGNSPSIYRSLCAGEQLADPVPEGDSLRGIGSALGIDPGCGGCLSFLQGA